MKRTVAGSLCLVFAMAAGAADAMSCATPAPQAGRRLVWGDEFDGTALDQSKWRFRATMNSSDCTYTNDSRTARVEDGWCPEQFRITADDTLPIEYWIDWVRLWQKDGEEIRLVKGEGKR